MIDKRVSDIIHFLKRNRKGSFSEIQSELGINQSQLKYSIKKLNEFLEENGVEPVDGSHQSLFINDGQYNFLIQTTEADFAKQYILNGQERLKLMFLLLLAQDEEYISLAHFYDLLDVGKTTVSQDIKELTDLLSAEGIEVGYSRQDGYQLVGEELAIRRHLFRSIMADFASGDKMVYTLYLSRFKKIELENFTAEIKQFNQTLGIQFVEDRFAEFCCFFALILNRLKNSKSHHKVNVDFDFKQFKEHQYSKRLCEHFGVKSENEQFYICAWMLGQSIGNLDEETPDKEYILRIVHQMMRRFEKISGIFFSDREEAVRQLYGHLRPCYYRLLFQFPLANQMAPKIKREYRDIYYLVSEVVKNNDKLVAQGISEDEIAYLTIHFASIIEKNGTRLAEPSVRAVVVCSNGIGSSAIIFEELRNLFPDIFFIGPLAVEEFKQLDLSGIDIIFSTIMEKTILASKRSVFFLHPIMNAVEKYNLIQNVYEKIGRYHLPDVNQLLQIIKKHTKLDDTENLKKELLGYLTQNKDKEQALPKLRLSDILLPQYIQKIPIMADQTAVIESAAQPLLAESLISQQYIEAITDDLRNPMNTFHIAPGILLPHTKPTKGVNGLGMSLGILEKPITIDDKEIRYIFVLAAVDNKQHLSAMADLVKLITNPQMSSVFDFHTETKDIYRFIKRSEET